MNEHEWTCGSDKKEKESNADSVKNRHKFQFKKISVWKEENLIMNVNYYEINVWEEKNCVKGEVKLNNCGGVWRNTSENCKVNGNMIR